ncbi:MAG TPA: tetratricopeptide repeat protein [Candidatus Acidoferrales bacterium]|nr:tetratricopeptide repeat protein [Candidatus Acidoferrales bacterium]
MGEKNGQAGNANPGALETQPASTPSPASDPNVTLSSSAAAFSAAERAPQLKSIGPYHLIRRLGEGGMGQVWLAEQTAPIQRQVALKLIKVGRYDDSVLQRFYAERQSLAIMDHPAIAKVFDAGATPDGQPYFVMEYVPGVPITDYCDRKRLRIRERLELFMKVCEGVQHAHQKAIMHRDLKPANILVVEVDGKPVPRIIDFGLAKPASPQIDGQTMFTQAGGWVGTPGYMSPEQADPGVLDVDTRTDVYSLGAVLYVLLTGFLPFENRDWRKQRFDEFLRHLREDDPPRPSTKVSTEKGSSKSAAEARGTEPRHLAGLLHGDLDWITMKALEKDRNRRYGTPSELATDIEHYLRHEPVVARPASTGYRLRKYMRRHRASVAVTAGLVLLLAGFAVTQAVQVRRITRERDRANRIAEFMSNVFRVNNPSQARGNTITARELLDKAAAQIPTALAKDPELQADMMDQMGRVYEHLGLTSRAEDLLRPGVEIRRRVLGSNHPETLLSINNLANALSDEGKLTDADVLYKEVIDRSRRVLGPAHHTTTMAMNNYALNLQDEGHSTEAEKMLRDVVEAHSRALGSEHPETLTAISNLANMLRMNGHFAESEKLNRQVLAARRRILGADDPDTLRSATNLALVLTDEQGHDLEAEQLLRPTLETQKRIVGPEHPDTIETMNSLATVCGRQGKLAEEETLLQQTIAIERRTLGPDSSKVFVSMNNLAALYEEEKKLPEAERIFRELVEVQSRSRGPQGYYTLVATTNLAAALQDEKRFGEAEKLGHSALEIERRNFGEDDPLTIEQLRNLAMLEQDLHHDDEAEKLLNEAVEHQTKVYGVDNPQTAKLNYALGAFYATHGNHDKAFSFLRQAVEHGLDATGLGGIDKDPDLKALHSDPRFAELLSSARQRASPKLD